MVSDLAKVDTYTYVNVITYASSLFTMHYALVSIIEHLMVHDSGDHHKQLSHHLCSGGP